MEIKDYIRYKDEGIQKIGRIEKISATLADDVLIIEVDNSDVITSDDLLKSDKSILHEIEVGDYVNGERVINIIKKHEYLEVSDEEIVIDKEDIKTIVTKQQFKAMQYVVKED